MQYFVYNHESNKPEGPLSFEELRHRVLSGSLTADSRISWSGAKNWVRASRIEGLFDSTDVPSKILTKSLNSDSQENQIPLLMNTKLLLGVLGSSILFIGVFMPIISIPVVGGRNYFQNGRGDGAIVLLLAVLSLGLVISKRYKALWGTGLASLSVMSFSFFNVWSIMSQDSTELKSKFMADPFEGLAELAMQSAQLEWGWAVLMIGVVSVLTSAFFKERINQLEVKETQNTISTPPFLLGIIAILLGMVAFLPVWIDSLKIASLSFANAGLVVAGTGIVMAMLQHRVGITMPCIGGLLSTLALVTLLTAGHAVNADTRTNNSTINAPKTHSVAVAKPVVKPQNDPPAQTNQPQAAASNTEQDNFPAAGFSKLILLPDNVPLEMVWCPAGSFMMGRYPGEQGSLPQDDPQHQVTFKYGFWMGKFEVTQAQWQAVMGNNPSYLKGAELPVENMSWNDCQQFIQKLNAMGKGTFRLPSEAEWEYACRAGTTTRFYWGDDPSYTQIKDYAWFNGNSGLTTHEVGQKYPNSWGLYDMNGNVFEWCQDWYHESYIDAPTDGQSWLNPVGSRRVLRGGSLKHPPMYCRSRYRHCLTPVNQNKYHDLGLRLVWAP